MARHFVNSLASSPFAIMHCWKHSDRSVLAALLPLKVVLQAVESARHEGFNSSAGLSHRNVMTENHM